MPMMKTKLNADLFHITHNQHELTQIKTLANKEGSVL